MEMGVAGVGGGLKDIWRKIGEIRIRIVECII